MSRLNWVIFGESLARALEEGHEYYRYADWLAVLIFLRRQCPLHMGLVE